MHNVERLRDLRILVVDDDRDTREMLRFILQQEAGEVIAVGSDVSGVAVGDRVAWANVPGSHVEALNIAANALVPVPDEVAAEVAAAAMLQGMTAHYLVTSTYPVQSGDSVLVLCELVLP